MVQVQAQKLLIAFITNIQPLRCGLPRSRMKPLSVAYTLRTIPNPAKFTLNCHILPTTVGLTAQRAIVCLTREKSRIDRLIENC